MAVLVYTIFYQTHDTSHGHTLLVECMNTNDFIKSGKSSCL